MDMPVTDLAALADAAEPGRSCPLHYRYAPTSLDRAPEVHARTLYVVGGLYGNDLALDALDRGGRAPTTLVLISPAIRLHRAAALASFKDGMSVVPGLGGWAWLQILPEFDPYKYNSFATNAGSVVHRITKRVDEHLTARARIRPRPDATVLLATGIHRYILRVTCC